jgi:hypothetical protein
MRRLSRNVRNSASEAWVTEPDPTSAAADSKTVRRAKATATEVTASKTTRTETAATAKVSATTATETASAMTTTTAAATAASPTGLSEGNQCDAN